MIPKYGSSPAKCGRSEAQSESRSPLDALHNTSAKMPRDSITVSPVYPAAMSLLGIGRGLSIRFPRFMKIRDDKGWEDATTHEQFAEMYREQIKAAPSRVKAVDPAQVVIRRGSEEEREGDGEDAGVDDGDVLEDEVEDLEE